MGHRQLQSVLLTRALMRAGGNRVEPAERTLEASWILNASLAERPDFISKLITVAVSGMQTAVLRVMKRPSNRWLPRMQQRTFTADVHTPYQLEAWSWTLFTVGLSGPFDLGLGTAGRVLTTPYVRLNLAGMSEALLKASKTLSSQHRCDFDVDRYTKEFEESFPRWNILGRIGTPSVSARGPRCGTPTSTES